MVEAVKEGAAGTGDIAGAMGKAATLLVLMTKLSQDRANQATLLSFKVDVNLCTVEEVRQNRMQAAAHSRLPWGCCRALHALHLQSFSKYDGAGYKPAPEDRIRVYNHVCNRRHAQIMLV